MDVKEPAFIIGNGTSRLEFDLMSIKDAGTMFGCNALYRDYEPDFLICVDRRFPIGQSYHSSSR